MFGKRQVFLFILVFAVSAVLMMPFRVAIGLVGLEGAGYQWSHVSGNIIRGQIKGLRFGEQAIGDVSLRVRPLGFVTGRLSYAATVEGAAVDIDTTVSFGFGKMDVTGLTGSVNLANTFVIPAVFRRSGGSLNFRGATVRFEDGLCRAAEGRADSDLLIRLVEAQPVTASALEGELSCVEDMLDIRLAGNLDSTENVTVRVILGQRAPSTFEAHIDTQNPILVSALAPYNFFPTDTGISLSHDLGLNGATGR